MLLQDQGPTPTLCRQTYKIYSVLDRDAPWSRWTMFEIYFCGEDPLCSRFTMFGCATTDIRWTSGELMTAIYGHLEDRDSIDGSMDSTDGHLNG